MLVLTRQASAGDRSILSITDPKTGGIVEVEVMSIRSGQVRLGIKAPRELPVHRKEIWLALQAEIPSGLQAEAAPPTK